MDARRDRTDAAAKYEQRVERLWIRAQGLRLIISTFPDPEYRFGRGTFYKAALKEIEEQLQRLEAAA